MAEEEDVGSEQGMSSWLPTHVIDETCADSKEDLKQQKQPSQLHGGLIKATAEPLRSRPLQTKSNSKPHQRPRYPINWAAGGSGMQAIFLESGQRSCGTGVFLPRRAGTDFQSNNKPAFSPVLLPTRVVQALNLNVHQLGLQIKPRRGFNNKKPRNLDHNSVGNKNGNDSSQYCVISQSRSSSPEIFLPKEWTY